MRSRPARLRGGSAWPERGSLLRAAYLAELAELYDRADRLTARLPREGCVRCARCCQPGRLGREPYVTSIELDALVEAAARRGGARVLVRPNGPGGSRRRLGDDGARACPMLSRELTCVVYAARPLGCRTFWCMGAGGLGSSADRRELQQIVRDLQQLAARHEVGGDVGRPLSAALRERRRR